MRNFNSCNTDYTNDVMYRECQKFQNDEISRKIRALAKINLDNF